MLAIATARPRPASARTAPRERFLELDLLRAFSVAAVVFIHAGSWIHGQDAPAQSGLDAAAITLARFCVPALIFASGLVSFRSARRSSSTGDFLRRRWLRTLVPWLAWTPVYAVADVLLGKVALDPHDLLVWLAYGAGHLYFLVLIAQLALLLPLLVRADVRLLVAIAAGAMALQLALGIVHTYGPVPNGALAWPLTYLPQMEAPFWAGWFLLGCAAGAGYERLRGMSWLWPGALIVTVAASLAVLAEAYAVPGDQWRQGTYAFLWPSRLPQVLALTAVLLWLGRDLAPRLRWLWAPVTAISQRSLGVYVLHVLALELLARSLLGSLPPAPRLVALGLGSLVAGYAATVLLARTRVGALALGEAAASSVPARGPAHARSPSPAGEDQGGGMR